MRKAHLAVISILVFTVLACGFSFSTANITEAKMARDSDGIDQTTVFAQDDKFYVVLGLGNAPDDTTVKAVWTVIEATETDPNTVIDETEVTGGDGQIWFELSNLADQLWPAGKYKVDLYLNEELDRTLEFEVEEAIAAVEEAEPTATSEPTATPVPTATSEPPPTAAAQSSLGDSLGSDSSSGGSADESSLGEDPEPELLPFQQEPYTHPSGAFTFAVPKGWELSDETDFVASFSDNNSLLGVEFFNAEVMYDESAMQTFIELYLDNFIVADEYELISQELQADDSIFVAVTSQSSQGNRIDTDFFFEQRDTILFILYFSTFTYEEVQPTWNEIIASYAVDAQAALAVAPAATDAPAATATAQPLPTPTPAPSVNQFAPQPGRSRIYLENSFPGEVFYDIGGIGKKVAPSGLEFIDIDAGRYTWTLSIPGGAANGEIDIGPNQSWVISVDENGSIGQGQIYP